MEGDCRSNVAIEMKAIVVSQKVWDLEFEIASQALRDMISDDIEAIRRLCNYELLSLKDRLEKGDIE